MRAAVKPIQLLLAVVMVTAPASSETDVVRVLSRYNQPVTSSMLRWVSVPGALPPNAVLGALEEAPEGTEAPPGKAFVCRLRNEGMWLSGQVRSTGDHKDLCVASMHGLVYRKKDYEVLENVEDSARLSWVRWDKYSRVPLGSVTVDDLNYVARRPAPNGYSHDLGKLDPDGLGKLTIVRDEDAAVFEDGEVLVETEPISYELTKVKFNLWRKRIDVTPLELGSARLSNDDPDDQPISRVDTVISYKYNYSLSWGHVQSVITGLPVMVKLANGTSAADFKWGIDEAHEKQDLYNVEALLPPGSAVNVTLHGNYTESTVPFTAVLTASYEDGERRNRPVSGNRRETAMWDVRPVFEQAVFLNGSVVPVTTTTTTTTTTTSTTTSTARTTTGQTPAPIPPSPIEAKPVEKKGGEVKSPQGGKGENSSMQSDEGEARASKGGAGGFFAAPLLVALALLAT